MDSRATLSILKSQFPVQAVEAGPKFELLFADIDQGTGTGFDQAILGQVRINTVLAVFEALVPAKTSLICFKVENWPYSSNTHKYLLNSEYMVFVLLIP